MEISVARFKAACTRLIEHVAETGEPVIITNRGKALARLVPDRRKPRGFGRGRATIEILCSDAELFRLGA